jgi:AmiR/NasT family two-component response regulator
VTTTPSAGVRGLRVLVADEDHAALRRLDNVLTDLGHEVTPYAVSVAEASELIASEDPDLTVVVVDEDTRHALALIAETVEFASGPVIAQIDSHDLDTIARAAELGISAYVEEVDAASLQGAIEVALRRHRETAALSEKVEQLQTALDRRAAIERAKGILMERHGLDEQGAFDLLREHARSQRRRVVDVAREVADGDLMLPPRA